MEDFDFLSDLKLRASWGANGSVQGLPRGYTTTPFTTDYFGTSYPIQGNESGPLYSGYKRTSPEGRPQLACHIALCPAAQRLRKICSGIVLPVTNPVIQSQCSTQA